MAPPLHGRVVQSRQSLVGDRAAPERQDDAGLEACQLGGRQDLHQEGAQGRDAALAGDRRPDALVGPVEDVDVRGLDQGLLVREVVRECTVRITGLAGDLPHGGRVRPARGHQTPGDLQDLLASSLAVDQLRHGTSVRRR
jgi:hypothetical protein